MHKLNSFHRKCHFIQIRNKTQTTCVNNVEFRLFRLPHFEIATHSLQRWMRCMRLKMLKKLEKRRKINGFNKMCSRENRKRQSNIEKSMKYIDYNNFKWIWNFSHSAELSWTGATHFEHCMNMVLRWLKIAPIGKFKFSSMHTLAHTNSCIQELHRMNVDGRKLRQSSISFLIRSVLSE